MKWGNDLLKFIFSVLVLYIFGLVIYESFCCLKPNLTNILFMPWLSLLKPFYMCSDIQRPLIKQFFSTPFNWKIALAFGYRPIVMAGW